MEKPSVSVKMRSQTDDLFAALPPVQNKLLIPGLIVCLVCGRGGRADLSRPLICDRCGANVPAAQALVDYKLVNAEKQLDQAYDKWVAARNTADAEARRLYDLYEELRIAQNPRYAVAEAKAAAGEVGPVFDLIRLWLAKDAAGEAWTAINEWAIQCDEVLR